MPSPTAALSESYRNPEGLPGSGFALEFATPAEASVWLTSYGEAVKACVGAEDAPFRLMEVDVTDTLVVDVRNYNGSVHSERADVDGNIVRLLTIQAEETLDNLRLTP